MPNYVDTYLKLLDQKRSAGEADSNARLNLALAALAADVGPDQGEIRLERQPAFITGRR